MQICLSTAPSAPPESFKGNSTDAKSIALELKEIPSSQRNGVITGYKVLFRTNIGSQMWNQTTTAGDKLSVTVQNLQANVVYDFKIAGLTKDGIGPYSNVITIKVKGPVHVAKGRKLACISKINYYKVRAVKSDFQVSLVFLCFCS